ncbi:MAG: DNA recombination/repair protein RecA, partial [Anaerolineae bacterium]|nr:DNA recombination/repair protein RecA [Anaerolineae bacterium]
DIMYNEGISRTGDVLDLATSNNIVDKRGAYFRYNDVLLGQGRENAKVYLAENPAILDELERRIRSESMLLAHTSVEQPEAGNGAITEDEF